MSLPSSTTEKFTICSVCLQILVLRMLRTLLCRGIIGRSCVRASRAVCMLSVIDHFETVKKTLV